jgi:two-component system chemotaxis response regulator CheY
VHSRAPLDVQQAQNMARGPRHGRHQSFDLVITDVNMPQMDGSRSRNLRSPALATHTAARAHHGAHAERKVEGREAGATGWLVKPFNPERLLATVAKVLK